MSKKKKFKESRELDSAETKGVGLPKNGKAGSALTSNGKGRELDSGKTKGVGYPQRSISEDGMESDDDSEVKLNGELSESDEEFLKAFNEEFDSEEDEMIGEEDEEEDFLSGEPDVLESEDEEEFLGGEDEVLGEEDEEEEYLENQDLEELLADSDEYPDSEELSEEGDEIGEPSYDLETNEDPAKLGLEEEDEDEVFSLDEADEEEVSLEESDEEEEEKLAESDDEEAEKEKLEEEEEAEEDKKEIQEAISAMFKGQKIALTEGFKNKVQLIFESAINARVIKEKKRLESKGTKKLAAIRENMYRKYGKKVDNYLNYVVEQWMKENKIAIEKSFQNRITESFMKDLRGVFLKHDIAVPKAKQNLVSKLGRRLEETKKHLDREIRQNLSQQKKMKMLEKKLIVNHFCGGLTAMQADKVKKLSEGIAFKDARSFANKLNVLKEQYFGEGGSKKLSLNETTNSKKEVETSSKNSVGAAMANYIQAAKNNG